MAKTKEFRWKEVGLFIISAVAGGAAALLVAVMLILSTERTQLAVYAKEFLAQDEKIAQNIDATLAAANASPYPACSDQDLTLLRTQLFLSPYLKDVGRVEGDTLACSAVVGHLAKPVERPAVAETTYKTRKIYFNVDLLVAKGHLAEVVSDGRANVVVSPDVFSDFSRPPMLFTGAIVDREKKNVLQMYSSSAKSMPIDLMLTDGPVQRDGFLYSPMCSTTRPDCVLTGIPMTVVWSANRGLMIAAFAVGAAMGLALAVIVWQAQQRKRSIGSQLRRALKKKKLWVVYQPVVNIHTNDIIGCEALVRWRDDHQRMVRPEVFIGVAEEEGFIGELTFFVLERVTQEMGDLLREKRDFHVSVNLSAKDLVDETFLSRLDAMLASRKVPASRLGLELTERSTTDKHVAIDVIRKLRDRGHLVYIDDFGTGYSSLSYLHELSVDVLKVDKVFTNTIGTDSITASIVPQILSMAQTLKLKVVVEGVEHQAQADYLIKFGGETAAQGWLYGRPLTSETLHTWLAEQDAMDAKEALAVG